MKALLTHKVRCALEAFFFRAMGPFFALSGDATVASCCSCVRFGEVIERSADYEYSCNVLEVLLVTTIRLARKRKREAFGALTDSPDRDSCC